MTEKKRTAPYIPFPTFTTALDNVAEHNVPNVIDRTVFPTFSGASVSGVLSAFKFFELTDDNGVPNDEMERLAKNVEDRKENIRKLLNSHYASLIQLDLSKVTPTQFDKEFSEVIYNVSGNTKTKAKSFFIKAAQFADIPISKLLLQKSRASTPRKRKSRVISSTVTSTDDSESNSYNRNEQESGTSKTIMLLGGGSLTVHVSVDLLSLTGKDRDFLFMIIDKLNEYEMGSKSVESAGSLVGPQNFSVSRDG